MQKYPKEVCLASSDNDWPYTILYKLIVHRKNFGPKIGPKIAYKKL